MHKIKQPDPIEIEPDAWCGWCGDPLPEPEERVHNKRYCSVRCKQWHASDKKRSPRIWLSCPICGTRFYRENRKRQCCSHKCASLAWHRRKKFKG
jgi:predicted nucleic acid-binding Zn ribbon protein